MPFDVSFARFVAMSIRRITLFTSLEEWAKVKLGKTGKEALNVAWAVAIKISKEGTEIYKDGGSDLIEGVITTQRVEQIYDTVGRIVSSSISEEILI